MSKRMTAGSWWAGIALTLLLSLPTAVPARADGGGGDSGGQDMRACPRGQVWDSRSQRCVQARSGILPDKALTDYAYVLAKAERYDEALEMLDLLQDRNTPQALNYRGYATRKLGRIDEGIGYYRAALKLDPKYAQVREYLGEAYVSKGDMASASEELKAIEALCGTECEEYQDLAQAIAEAKRG
jgi:tetratricopeptide (TPR) repeat protein